MNKKKKKRIGMKDTCANCGKAVYWTGEYWTHEGDTQRHPANPDWDKVL